MLAYIYQSFSAENTRTYWAGGSYVQGWAQLTQTYVLPTQSEVKIKKMFFVQPMKI